MEKVTFRVVLPERSEDAVSEGLRVLTKALCPDGGFFGLGGEYGYGERWDDDVFMMHPFCWCEKDDCPWCGGGCDCPEESFHSFVDGEEVSSKEWLDFYKQNVPDVKDPNWKTISDEICSRRHRVHEEICDYCLCEGVYKEHGREHPNFWHKKTDFKVWWYKYIGRSMEVENPTGADWTEILEECLNHLGNNDLSH